MSSFFGISLVQLILGVAVFILVTITIFSCVSNWDDHNAEQEALQTYEAFVLNARLLLSEAQQAKTTFPSGTDDFQYRRLSVVMPDGYFVHVFAGNDDRYTLPECKGKACVCLFEKSDDDLLLPRDPSKTDYKKKLVQQCDILDYGFPVYMSPTNYVADWLGKPSKYATVWAWGTAFSQSYWIVAHRSTKPAKFNGLVTNDFHVNMVLFTEHEMEQLGTPQLHPVDPYGPQTICPVELDIGCGKIGVVFNLQDAVPPFSGQTVGATRCFGVSCSQNDVCYLSYDNPKKDASGTIHKYGKGACLSDGAKVSLDKSIVDTQPIPLYYSVGYLSNDPLQSGKQGLILQMNSSLECGVESTITEIRSTGVVVSGMRCNDPGKFCYIRDNELETGTNANIYTIDGGCLTTPSQTI